MSRSRAVGGGVDAFVLFCLPPPPTDSSSVVFVFHVLYEVTLHPTRYLYTLSSFYSFGHPNVQDQSRTYGTNVVIVAVGMCDWDYFAPYSYGSAVRPFLSHR